MESEFIALDKTGEEAEWLRISWKILLISPNQWHQELLSSGIITVDYVKSKDNVSDPLTKGLSREGVERASKGMGLRPRIADWRFQELGSRRSNKVVSDRFNIANYPTHSHDVDNV
ncbi:hypothetical protein CQW23_10389 [Capsicum baccatum]|uniref:Uncharacterized protein n=1 Tax=Capsicum baccatum TaxID=33114 RepID=A0A2G2WZH5_CAPBA|nr:hypothetical protein CQW23_10389 [Capsicum baccatum]